MTKKAYLEKVNTFKLKKETKKKLIKQIELFYSYNSKTKTNYKINDKVTLTKNNLIHGSRADLKDLKIISNVGLIASEFYKGIDEYKKKPYVLEVWDIRETIPLEDWIKKYAEVTIKFRDGYGTPKKYVLSTFDNIIENIKKETNYLDYVIVQNQEQRFVPNDIYIKDQTIAFILEYSQNDEIIMNDIFNKEFNKRIIKDMLPKWFYRKYFLKDNYDEYQTDRQKAILFGLPVSMIKGIMVTRKLEKDINYLKKIKNLFPSCYICNIDGTVIF